MLGNILTASTEGILVDLGLYLVGRVREEDGGVRVRGGHLGLGPLEGGEEGGVDEGRFEESKTRSNISGHPEVGILINGTGDETGNIGLAVKDEGKCRWEGGSGLNCGKPNLSNGATFIKSKNSLEKLEYFYLFKFLIFYL